jgi:spectrin beta
LGLFSDEWSKLLETVELRDEKLVAAGEIHRFNRDVAESLSRIQEKYVAIPDDLGRDLNSVLGLIRRHENFETDLVALEAQLQVCIHHNIRYIISTDPATFFVCFSILRSWWMIRPNYKWHTQAAMLITSELNKLW